MPLIITLLFFCSTLCGERITLNPSAKSYESHTPCKQRVDVYDFNGLFPELENIDIDATRKKNVNCYLTGDYPVLEAINYQGAFGILKAQLTGNFPKLSFINVLCTSCAIDLNLAGHWQKSCNIHIRGADQDVILHLPKDVGIIVHTHTGIKGRVVIADELKKKGWFGVFNKTYKNPLAKTSDIVLTIVVEATDGRITLD